MIGRILGALAGLVIALAGIGILKPARVAKLLHLGHRLGHLDLGPFGQYRTLVGAMTVLVGAAVAIAALQRQIERRSPRPASHLFAESESVPSAPEA